MMIARILALLLIALPASAQMWPNPGPGHAAYGGGGGGGGGSALYLNDYEGGSGATCTDSSSGDSCTPTGGAAVVAFTHPSGSNGLEIAGAGADAISNAISEAGDITMDFAFEINSAESPTNSEILSLVSAANAQECGMEVTAVSGASLAVNGSVIGQTNGPGISLTGLTDYWARLTLNVTTRVCTLYVWSAGYGNTLVSSSASPGGGTALTVTGVRATWQSGQDIAFRMGETVVCAGIPASPTTDGRCDTL